MMAFTFESNSNITYDIEIVRHYEIIPGEDSSLEVKSCTLSDGFNSPMDIIRKFRLEEITINPFAPLNIST